LTFITDLDDLIRHHHGDVKKLREIRDTVRHDNFITTEDKNYVESLITMHLKNQPLDKSLSRKRPDIKIKLQPKPTLSSPDLKNNFTFNFSSNKKLGILGGVAAAIAIIVIVGFTAINTPTDSIVNSGSGGGLLMNIDQTTYQRADIISISGNVEMNASVDLSIKNANGVTIWKETVNPKSSGQFSTLVIVGGGGWEDNGSYTLWAETNMSVKDVTFRIVA